MQFPKRKNEIVLLAEQMLAGITANATTYPEAPFTVTDLTASLTSVKTALSTRQAKEAAVTAAVEAENTAFETLTQEMKKILYLAEAYHENNTSVLSLIGWGSSSTPVANAPSQPRELSSEIVDRGQVTLKWQPPKPNTGGAVRFYRIERRQKQSDATWLDWGKDAVYSSTAKEITLTDQPKGVEVEYRVISVNVAGESTPSNTVRLVL
jgi:hypothetical protein